MARFCFCKQINRHGPVVLFLPHMLDENETPSQCCPGSLKADQHHIVSWVRLEDLHSLLPLLVCHAAKDLANLPGEKPKDKQLLAT